MFFTFLLGAAAGFATPYVEPIVRQTVEQVARDRMTIGEHQFDTLTLVLLLLLAALVTGAGGSVALLVGALVGVLAKPVIAAIQGSSGE